MKKLFILYLKNLFDPIPDIYIYIYIYINCIAYRVARKDVSSSFSSNESISSYEVTLKKMSHSTASL